MFEDVAYGDYFLKETAAPDNYELDEMLYPITISDETIDPVVISTEMPKQISLRVQAVDAETGLPEAMTKSSKSIHKNPELASLRQWIFVHNADFGEPRISALPPQEKRAESLGGAVLWVSIKS